MLKTPCPAPPPARPLPQELSLGYQKDLQGVFSTGVPVAKVPLMVDRLKEVGSRVMFVAVHGWLPGASACRVWVGGWSGMLPRLHLAAAVSGLAPFGNRPPPRSWALSWRPQNARPRCTCTSAWASSATPSPSAAPSEHTCSKSGCARTWQGRSGRLAAGAGLWYTLKRTHAQRQWP